MSAVSRSVYQKLKEENKRLLNDIYIMTMNSISFESIQVRSRWRKKFTEEQGFNNLLRDVLLAHKNKNTEPPPIKSPLDL